MIKTARTVVLFLAYASASTTGLVMLKLSLATKVANIRSLGSVLKIVMDARFILGFIMYCTSFVLWLYILAKYPLTLSYPIANSLVLILVTLLGVILFKEHLGWLQQVGLLFCLAGIVLVYAR
jgi:multidrug transporter EmrE-like cation transporter